MHTGRKQYHTHNLSQRLSVPRLYNLAIARLWTLSRCCSLPEVSFRQRMVLSSDMHSAHILTCDVAPSLPLSSSTRHLLIAAKAMLDIRATHGHLACPSRNRPEQFDGKPCCASIIGRQSTATLPKIGVPWGFEAGYTTFCGGAMHVK